MSEEHTTTPSELGEYASEPDLQRRAMLRTATTALGLIGVGVAAVPFVESWNPSESALALGAPVEIDISALKPGTMLTAQWRQKPVWVLHREQSQLAELPRLNGRLKDPLSKEPQQAPDLAHWNPIQRSVMPQYLVLVGICTHLGCIPKYRPTPGDPTIAANWPGGFFCPCHGSRYDLAGRVMDGSPAPLNLPVPPHYYRKPTVIVAGATPDGASSNWSPDQW
ncbi:MAG: ubiquinol-cytochrome c reductase iron-sulfur subunit [Steroidobacteraceae bacterium]